VTVIYAKHSALSEFQILSKYLETNGKFINSSTISGMDSMFISAKEVHDLLGTNILIIDIRDEKTFAEGHIKGALNINPNNIIEFFTQKINPFDYDKIITVCYTGQATGIVTSLLRIMGYKNVYDMKWGMCVWNEKLNIRWRDNIKDRNPEMLETTANPRISYDKYPTINTGLKNPKDILIKMADSLLKAGIPTIAVKFDKFITEPSKYYIIAYLSDEQYNSEHLTGSVLYNSFTLAKDLKTLPVDKPILVYSENGMNSTFIVSYLWALGYKVYGLSYGSETFIHTKQIQNNRDAFIPSLINNFEYVTN